MSDEEVTRDEIKKIVIEKLKAVLDVDDEIEESAELEDDLGMTANLRGALGITYSKISKRYGGLVISIDEAEELETVEETIDLVHKRARGKK